MAHAQLPYILTIPAGGVPQVPAAAIPVADLADASHAYQDHRMRFAGRALTFPPGQVLIGSNAFEVAPEGGVWFDNAMIVGAQ